MKASQRIVEDADYAGVPVFLGPVTRAFAAGESLRGSWKAPGPWRGNYADIT